MAAPTTLEEALAAIVVLQNKFAEQHPDEACPPEECVAKDLADDVTHLIGSNGDTNCENRLNPATGIGLPVVNGTSVEVKDGSAADPIQLDSLDPEQGDFAGLVSLLEDGTLKHWTPLPSDKRHKLTTKGNVISQTLDKTYNEFLASDIPEVCCEDATYIIGGTVTVNDCGEQVIRLVKIPRATFYACVCNSCNLESYDQVWNINQPA